jgi:hypothetical protein
MYHLYEAALVAAKARLAAGAALTLSMFATAFPKCSQDALEQSLVNVMLIFSLSTVNFASPDAGDVRRLHESQVATIVLLSGVLPGHDACDPRTGLAKQSLIVPQLAEVRTGEGKSIVLGVLAAFYAVWGFDVDMLCFSSRLASRDMTANTREFAALGVFDKISYGTFDAVSDMALSPIRDKVHGVLQRPDAPVTPVEVMVPSSRRIALIDEHDAFLGPEFFGSSYNVGANFETAAMGRFLDRLSQNTNAFARDITATDVDGLGGDPAMAPLLLLHARALRRSALQHRLGPTEWPAVAARDEAGALRLGYKTKDSDCIHFKKRLPHQTPFDYIEATKAKGLPLVVSEAYKKSLLLYLGSLSYGRLASTLYGGRIMGVTGTLRSLPPAATSVLARHFGMSRLIYVPSAFGTPRLTVLDPLVVYAAYFAETLAANIVKHRHTSGAVLVFFDTIASLEAMLRFLAADYESAAPKYHIKPGVVTELDSNTDVAVSVGSAVFGCMVTFLTASFCRGYDFRTYGATTVTVLQTFFSPTQAHFEQCVGRTCRQGNTGTYQMILTWESTGRQPPGYLHAALASVKSLVTSTITEMNDLRQAAETKLLAQQEQSLRCANAREDVSMHALRRIALATDRDTVLRVVSDIGLSQFSILNFLFVVDVSLSMDTLYDGPEGQNSGLHYAHLALHSAVETLAAHHPSGRFAVVTFGESGLVRVPWSPHSGAAVPRTASDLRGVTPSRGTNYGAAFAAAQLLMAPNADAADECLAQKNTVVVFLTDGAPFPATLPHWAPEMADFFTMHSDRLAHAYVMGFLVAGSGFSLIQREIQNRHVPVTLSTALDVNAILQQFQKIAEVEPQFMH